MTRALAYAIIAAFALSCTQKATSPSQGDETGVGPGRMLDALKEIKRGIEADDNDAVLKKCAALAVDTGQDGCWHFRPVIYALRDDPKHVEFVGRAWARNKLEISAEHLRYDRVVYAKQSGERFLLKTEVTNQILGQARTEDRYFSFVEDHGELLVLLVVVPSLKSLHVFDGIDPSSRMGKIEEYCLDDDTGSSMRVRAFSAKDWLERGFPKPAPEAVAAAEGRKNLEKIKVSMIAFQAVEGGFPTISSAGATGREPVEWGAPPCGKECGRGHLDACASFSCIGFKPEGKVPYRYACNASPKRDDFTCAASADLDGNGTSKTFVFGTNTKRAAGSIVALIPKIGNLGSCKDGAVQAYETVDCDPREF